MYELAQLSLILALAAAVYTTAAAFLSTRRPTVGLIRAYQNGVALITGLLTAATGALLISLIRVDLGLEYVASHTSADLPVFYRITAIWAGNEGSLLFWSWMLAVFTLVVLIQRRREGAQARLAIGVLVAIQTFFLSLLVLVADPFEALFPVPTQGLGLNPLLQNPGMVFHPPTTYLGYVGFTIPFAFAVAALISGRLDARWIRMTRRWTLFAWLMLSVGTLFGAQWAYMELGWGGYWGWDPVENASLMPWLTATAFLHSVMIQERRGMLKGWNLILIMLTFELSIFGTFMTRSGILSSVHAFAGSGLGPFFTLFIGSTAILCAVLLAWRWSALKSDNDLGSLISRESSFLLNNWILVAAAIAVLWGTTFPLLSEAVTGTKVSVGAPYFNRIMVPIGLVLLFLTGVAPLIAWRKASIANLKRNFRWPLAAAALTLPVAWTLGARGLTSLIAYGLLGFITGGLILEFVRGIRVRRSRHREFLPIALARLVSGHRRRYGGYIVHFGVVLMVMGIVASNTGKRELEVTLGRGESANLGIWSATFNGLRSSREGNIEIVTADLDIAKAGRSAGKILPEKHFHPGQDNPMTEVDIRSTPVEDFYVILAGWENPDRATFKILINPMVWWIWFGNVILIIGTVVAGWPERRKKDSKKVSAAAVRNARRAVSVAGALLLMAMPPATSPALSAPSVFEQSPQPVPAESGVQIRQLSPAAAAVARQILCTCGCENMLVADCQCGTAANMQRDIEASVEAGMGIKQIVAGYVQQYGKWIFAAPEAKGFDLTAWIFPFLVLLGGGVFVGNAVVRWTRSLDTPGRRSGRSARPTVEDELLRMRIRRQVQEEV